MTHEDRDLQTWFETLREGDRRATPPFRVDDRPRLSGQAVLHYRLAAAFVLLIIVLIVSLPRRPVPIEQLTEWRSPTASLLETPKSPLLTTAPSITR